MSGGPLRIGVVVLLSILALTGLAKDPQSVLRIGQVTDDADTEYKLIEPLIRYLASHLQDVGIERGEVLLAADDKRSTLIRYMRERKLDIVIESASSAVLFKSELKAVPILLAVVRGATAEVGSVIFVRQDSAIRRLEDLQERTIAFEDAGSATSYYLPMCWMRSRGLGLAPLDSFSSPVPSAKVGYVFSGSRLNTASWVFYGKVAAGAMSKWHFQRYNMKPEGYRGQFRAIGETIQVPRMLVLVRNGIPSKLVARIKQELLGMEATEPGQAALNKSEFQRFTELSPGALQPMEELLASCGVLSQPR